MSLEISEFVSTIIKKGLCSESKRQCSVSGIFAILKKNNFRIVEGVDSAEILAFAN
jgi:uncharacterized protein YaaR (DUF327 family)